MISSKLFPASIVSAYTLVDRTMRTLALPMAPPKSSAFSSGLDVISAPIFSRAAIALGDSLSAINIFISLHYLFGPTYIATA